MSSFDSYENSVILLISLPFSVGDKNTRVMHGSVVHVFIFFGLFFYRSRLNKDPAAAVAVFPAKVEPRAKIDLKGNYNFLPSRLWLGGCTTVAALVAAKAAVA